MGKRVCKDDQIRLIMECRQSGLSDYQWCEQNGVYLGNFYNWVSKLRKAGYTFPESAVKSNAIPNRQEVVKLDLVRDGQSSYVIEQNVRRSISPETHLLLLNFLLEGLLFAFLMVPTNSLYRIHSV